MLWITRRSGRKPSPAGARVEVRVPATAYLHFAHEWCTTGDIVIGTSHTSEPATRIDCAQGIGSFCREAPNSVRAIVMMSRVDA